MINFRKTKILAKIADNRSEVPFLKNLFEAGADVAWLNTAHQDEASTFQVVEKIRSISTQIPIMIDTKGPEIRTRDIETPLMVQANAKVIITGDLSYKGENVIHVSYPNFHNEIPVGESMLYDDASIEIVVEKRTKQGLECIVKSAGVIKNKKSLNIPNVHIKLPALSEKDKGFIHFCAKYNIDYIAHSFVRGKEDIFEIQDILKKYPNYKGKIISKIENREGFKNLKEILTHSHGLMVARGDLGAEVLLEEVPYMQKKMVELALVMGKYCIVATQALDSMIKHPRPTRAEITDVANAVLDGTGAMSMSGETAYGDFPFEATRTMGRIMKYTETKQDDLIHSSAVPKVSGVAYKAAKKILSKAKAAKVSAIVIAVKDTEIVRALAAYRPRQIIVAVCRDEAYVRELKLAYAIRPILSPSFDISGALQELKSTEGRPKGGVLIVKNKMKGTDLEMSVKAL